MVVVNDLPSCTHTVQIMWFFDSDNTYVVTTVAENEAVVIPRHTENAEATSDEATMPLPPSAKPPSSDKPPCRGVLFANNMFTCALDDRFFAKCQDADTAYTLFSSALYPNDTDPTPLQAPSPTQKTPGQRVFCVISSVSMGFLAMVGIYTVANYILFLKK